MAEGSQAHSLDDPTEMFDLVDEHDRVIGTVRREQAHSDPRLIHRSVQVLVFDRAGRLFLQRRSRHKDLFAGYLCASACGHVASTETYAATAQREIHEELGISPPLLEVARTVVRSAAETEMTAIFVAHSDGPFVCHPTETDGGMFLSASELADRLAASSLNITPAAGVAITRALRAGVWPEAEAVAPDIIGILTA